jgi:hypothetical protein
MSDKLIFDGSSSEPRDLSELIGQAMGAASMCWDNVRGAGVFQSERASQITQEVIDWIEANYELKVGKESNLISHARRELRRIGEEPDVIAWYLSVVRAFAAYGHSGGSADATTGVLERLLRYKPLSELTDDPAEWIDRSEMSSMPWWQNIRDSRAMSHDGGKTYWTTHEAEAAGGSDAAQIHHSVRSGPDGT